MTIPFSGHDAAHQGRAVTHNLIGQAVLKSVEAAAWCAYVWILSRMLPSSDLGRALFALVFASCTAGLLTVGWKNWLRASVADGRDASAAWSAAVAGFAARALIVLPVMAFVSGKVGGKLLFPSPELPAMIAILAGLLGLLRLGGYGLQAGSDGARGAILTGPLPVLLALGTVALIPADRALSLDLVLGLHAICLLVPLVLAARRLPKLQWSGDLPKPVVFVDSVVQSGPILFRNVDVMVIGLVLSPVEAAIYLIVRGFALILDMVFGVLGRALVAPITRSHRNRERERFVAQMARANLGFLLIGGAGALFLFLAVNPLLHLFGVPTEEARLPLIYLIAAQAAPAIFGATHLVMSVTKLDVVRAWIVWAAMPLALIVTFMAAREGIVSLAATYAMLQIGATGVCAVVVALNCGVWPGLTAMLHGRIRLR